MKKIVIALLVAVLLAGLVPVGLSLAEDNYATVYSGNEFGVKLREGPATTYASQIILPSGTTVTVLETGTLWTRIQAGTRTGYMMSKFLVAGGSSSGVKVINTATVFADNGLRTWLRSSPNGKRLGLYSDGTPVNVLEYGDEWCRVMIGSSIGYMMTRYLTMAAAPTPTPVPAFVPLTAVTVNYPYPLLGDTLLPVTTPAGATVTCLWQWVDNSGNVTNRGTNTAYAVSADDVGHMIKLTVTGTGLYAGKTFSCVTDPVTASKVITGVMIHNNSTDHTSPVSGDVLSAIIAPSSATATYSWRVAGVEKATTATYTIAAADIGKTVQVFVTGTGSFSGSASSKATEAVADANKIVSVKLSTQYPVVGSALSAITTPAGAAATYIWYVNGAPIATSATYTPSTFDLGDVVSVKVTGTGSFTGVATSADSDPVSSALLTGVTIDNVNPSVDATLTASVAPAAAQDSGSVRYQWYANKVAIPGATARTYTVEAAYLGQTLYVVAKGDGVYGGAAYSNTTAAVVSSPVLTGVALNTLSPIVGDTITATLTPTLNAKDLAKCTFIWQIGSARFVGSQSYTVGAGDIGQSIRVQVNPGGGTVVTSAATNAVANTMALTGIGVYSAYASTTSKVALAGEPVVGQTIYAEAIPTQAHDKVFYIWNVDGVETWNQAYKVKESDRGKYINISIVDLNNYSNPSAVRYTGVITGRVGPVRWTTPQTVDLKSVLVPKVDRMPVYKVNGTTTSGITYSASVTWYPALSANGTFKANETYTATLTFSFATTDYSLGAMTGTGGTAQSINGNVATCTFGTLPPDDLTITNLNIAGLTAPVVGVAPVKAITKNVQYDGGPVSWSPNDGKFVVGQVYTATVALTAESGYTFNGLKEGSSTFTVVGATTNFTIDDATGKTAKVIATFPATASNTTASVKASRTTVPVGSSKKYVQCTATLLNYPGDQSGVKWKWELSGAYSSDTKIDQNGLVTVALDEVTGRTLTVTATTQNLTNASGVAYSATTTVTTAAEGEVTGTEVVTIISAPNELGVGEQGIFAAEVSNAKSEVVVWSVSGVNGTKHAGTTINGDGLLTVSADETVKQLAVTARSVNGSTSKCYVTVVYTVAPAGVAFVGKQETVEYNATADFKVNIVPSAGATNRKLSFTARVGNAGDVGKVLTLSPAAELPLTTETEYPGTITVLNDSTLAGTEVWVSAVYTETTAALVTNTYKDTWAFGIVAGSNDDTQYSLNVTPGNGTNILGTQDVTQSFTAAYQPTADGVTYTYAWSVTAGAEFAEIVDPAANPATLKVKQTVTESKPVTLSVTCTPSVGDPKTVEVTITLQPADAGQSITISPSSAAPMAKGTTLALTATMSGVTWESSDPSVATVDAVGTVTAVKAGTTQITAKKDKLVSPKVEITVLPSLVIAGPSSVNAGDPVTISATLDGTGSIADLTWTSDNADVVESAGITATATGATFTVKSTAPNNSAVTLKASGTSDGVAIEATCTLNVIGGRILTVVDGVASGAGSGKPYAVGSSVTIQATVPAGSTFKAWTGLDGVTITTGSLTTSTIVITMPDRSVDVAATFNTVYTVTVTDGVADKTTCLEGETVTITANTPAAHKAFSGWSTTDIPVPAGASTTFTMPGKNVAIAANYIDLYTLTVIHGAPTGTEYPSGETVTVTADASQPGVFDHWTVTDAASVSSTSANPVLITIDTKSVTAEAVFKYQLTVIGGSGSNRFNAAEDAPITASIDPNGGTFAGWTISGGGTIADATAASTSVKMDGTGNATVTATYSYPVTVHNGTGDGNFKSGDPVTITADAPAPGKAFDGWEATGIAVPTGSPATFTMPANEVVVTAKYKDVYTLTLTKCSAGKAAYAAGESVTVTPDMPDPGKEFDSWTVSGIGSLSGNPGTFTMPSEPVSVTANYKDVTP